MNTGLIAPRASLPRPAPPAHRALPANVTVAALEPRMHAAWDRFNKRTSDGSFFHSVAWMQAVRDAFGHEPLYLLARRNDEVVGILPLFVVHSLLGGTMLVSVPYGVSGGIVAGDDDEAVATLFDRAVIEARTRNARCIDLRSPRALLDGVATVDGYVTFQRRLPARRADVLGWLPRKARAAARGARNKHRLTVNFDHGYLRTVWELYAESMRRIGSLNYPYRFFESLLHHAPANHLVTVVSGDGRPVAGLVSFTFGKAMLPYFVGTRRSVYGINNLLYLSVMERAVETGCSVFDFGRSRIDNEGCCNFKRFHGFSATELGYQRYTLPGHRVVDLTAGNPRLARARRWWRHLPLPLTRSLGAWLSRHIPG